MKFSKTKEPSFEWNTGLKGWILSSVEDFPRASGAYFEVTGNHGKVKTKKSDRTYFVISGSGEFIINGNVILVKRHDMIIIPKDTLYDYKATRGKTLKLFLLHTPAYNRDAEVRYDKTK